jgi:hypothetical protein
MRTPLAQSGPRCTSCCRLRCCCPQLAARPDTGLAPTARGTASSGSSGTLPTPPPAPLAPPPAHDSASTSLECGPLLPLPTAACRNPFIHRCSLPEAIHVPFPALVVFSHTHRWPQWCLPFPVAEAHIPTRGHSYTAAGFDATQLQWAHLPPSCDWHNFQGLLNGLPTPCPVFVDEQRVPYLLWRVAVPPPITVTRAAPCDTAPGWVIVVATEQEEEFLRSAERQRRLSPYREQHATGGRQSPPFASW